MDLLEAILWLTLNVYHEARSEDQFAQIAVVHVVLNRAEKRNQTVKEVVLAPHQFSWTLTKKDWQSYDIKVLLNCLESVIIATQGHDFTQGATFYHRVDIHPYWADAFQYVNTFGSHKFYRRIR